MATYKKGWLECSEYPCAEWASGRGLSGRGQRDQSQSAEAAYDFCAEPPPPSSLLDRTTQISNSAPSDLLILVHLLTYITYKHT